ncbi:membrane dipeptidase (plasmid) [Arthrobacter sp. G.S.26]|uniref:membrane dipeptidase n=1 Tax=Arthrobacter sp. G.S.26 TaxID=3433706 RepID=UPI003D77BB6F
MIIDAKVIPTLDRSIFADMVRNKVSAVGVVCSIWEDLETSKEQLHELKAFIDANDDLVFEVDKVSRLESDEAKNRTGIIISWQNSTGFGGDVTNVQLFQDAGLRVVQPVFLARNEAGTGCLVSPDGGLTSYGQELIKALNFSGIAIDLSHVGNRTAGEVIRCSAAPVFYSMTSPRTLNNAMRNKSDDDMRMVADRGGVICLTTLRPYLPSANEATIENMADAVLYVRRIVGDDAVGIGSDLIPGQDASFLEYVAHDLGTGKKLRDNVSGSIVLPGFEDFSGYGNLKNCLRRKGLSSTSLDKLFGKNLLRFFGQVWAGEALPRTAAAVM